MPLFNWGDSLIALSLYGIVVLGIEAVKTHRKHQKLWKDQL